MTEMQGCVGMSFVVDRDSGRCIATSSWESMDEMRASFDQLAPMRERGAEIIGSAATVDEWEIALMHRDHTSGDGACCRITWGQTSDVDRVIEGFREHGAAPDRGDWTASCERQHDRRPRRAAGPAAR